MVVIGRSLLIFSDVTFKMAACSGLCRWHGFRSVSQVCLGISISNFICMLMVVIGRSLLICSDVTFKKAAWWPYWILWFLDSNFSLALNINSKLKWHNTYIYIWVTAYWFSETSLSKWPPGGHIGYFGFEYQLQTSVVQCLCIWVRAYWFSVTSFSKWLPGGHIRFFSFWTAWFRQRNSGLLWNFSFKFHVHVLCGCRQKPNDCQLCGFQNGCLVILNNV